ncbi:MAG TPA: hypothetical protein VGJ53_19430 [Micromonosporaceae bacterium]
MAENNCLPNLDGHRPGASRVLAIVVIMILLMAFALALLVQMPASPLWAIIALIGIVSTWTIRICRSVLFAAPTHGPTGTGPAQA